MKKSSKCKTGPIVTKGTKSSEGANDHAKPMDKGRSKPIPRTWPPGEPAPVSKKHGFVNWKSEHI